MSEQNMPAAEATDAAREDERTSYEFAFHVLPTVAEGEVPGVFSELKTRITKQGGEIFAEEEPKRFDLAYDIVKHIEGKNRRFSSAYFGWIRFYLPSEELVTLTEAIEEEKRLLRYLIVKLTRAEEANPFYFHEALAADEHVTEIEEKEVVDDDAANSQTSEPVEEASSDAAATTTGSDEITGAAATETDKSTAA